MIWENCLFQRTVGKYQKEFLIAVSNLVGYTVGHFCGVFVFSNLSNEYIAADSVLTGILNMPAIRQVTFCNKKATKSGRFEQF